MTTASVNQDEIKGFECKHAVYTQANDGSLDDLVIIKEQIHLKDGTKVPNLRFIENYKRPFWVTREGHRNHEQKKEWEDERKLQKFSCRQSELIKSVGRALGRPGYKGSLKMLCRSPYVYGADITTPTLIKRQYLDRYPELRTQNDMAVVDIETDVLNSPKDYNIIYLGLTFKERAFLAVTKKFLGTIYNPEEKLHQAFEKYLKKHKDARNIQLEVLVVDSPAQAVIECFNRLHTWQPDFVSAWNGWEFDYPKLATALEREGYDPAYVFSDPRVPQRYKFLRIVPGQTEMTTAAGTKKLIPPSERWHEVECAASFYLIDSMCLGRRLRMAQQKEPWGLDYQLDKAIKERKLKFEEADGYEKLEWHEFMQKHYKIEYGIYCLFDCIGVELRDDKVKDVQQSISVQGDHSEYKIFKSQPKRLVDDLHFFCLDRGKVIASCSDQMEEEVDRWVIDRKGFVITLPPHTLKDNGLKWIQELPNYHTNIRRNVADQFRSPREAIHE